MNKTKMNKQTLMAAWPLPAPEPAQKLARSNTAQGGRAVAGETKSIGMLYASR
jgi:hypothetical protein